VLFGGTQTALHKVKWLDKMPNWASWRPLLSRTEEGLPGADAKLQEAFEYSVIGHLLLSPGIIFIIDYLQRSYKFSIFICL